MHHEWTNFVRDAWVLRNTTVKHWGAYLSHLSKMLINEYHFLGTAQLSNHDGNRKADRGARLPTEVKEFDVRKGLRKDPERGPLDFSLDRAAWKAPLSSSCA